MPTVVTHALLPLIAATAVPKAKISRRLIAAGMAAAALPDADVIGSFFLGVPHTNQFGHRGATHTFLFAVVVGLTATLGATRLRASRLAVFAFVFLSAVSHLVTDMLTDGGKGLMLFWPVDKDRFHFLFRPVEVAPIGLQAVYSGKIVSILVSEALWLLIPALVLALIVRTAIHLARNDKLLIDSGARRP